MASIGSATSSTSSAAASIVRAADENIGTAAALLKKATDADKNLVSTLLPTSDGSAGKVNIAA